MKVATSQDLTLRPIQMLANIVALVAKTSEAVTNYDWTLLKHRSRKGDATDFSNFELALVTLVATNSEPSMIVHLSPQPQEYADSLKDSGVHRALLVFEPGFGPNELAQALGISQSKNIIRRHLMSEFNSLIQPAR